MFMPPMGIAQATTLSGERANAFGGLASSLAGQARQHPQWSQATYGSQGPQGPQGPQGGSGRGSTGGCDTGPQGPEYLLPVTAVACPAGEIATGGGYQATGYLILSEDGPVGGDATTGPAGWQIAGIAQSGAQTVTVYAICSSEGAA
jgi:hypothetical protein